jgi:hypothetical protein
MGKAKHFKQIRKFASQLPVLNTRVPIGEIIAGADLIGEGVNEINGEKVSVKKKYRRIRQELTPVNHYRQMKKYFYKHGAAGVKAYVLAVQRHDSAQKVKAAQKVAA